MDKRKEQYEKDAGEAALSEEELDAVAGGIAILHPDSTVGPARGGGCGGMEINSFTAPETCRMSI